MIREKCSFELPSTLISISKEQISSDLAGEAVILDLKSGTYYGLNEVGVKIWGLIQSPQKFDTIREAILAEYEVDAETCDRDLMAVLQDLKAAGLIEVTHVANS